MEKDTIYYFALGDVLKDLKLTQVEARRRYRFNRKGRRYISKTNFQSLCTGNASPRIDTLNIICNAMGLEPAAFWRVRKESPRET